MTNTLEDVIKFSQEWRGLQVTDENRIKYVAFLHRQLRANPDYYSNRRKSTYRPSTNFSLLADKLLLFSYLIGETLITAGYEGRTEEKRITSVDDLYLLRRAEIGVGGGSDTPRRRIMAKKRQTDDKLRNLLYRTVNRNTRRESMQNWGESIDELGKDEDVVRYFGQQITYKLVLECPSPNPLTSSHGGYRWDNKKS